MPPGPFRPLLVVKLACKLQTSADEACSQIGLLDSVLVSHTGEAEESLYCLRHWPKQRRLHSGSGPENILLVPQVLCLTCPSRLASGGFLEWRDLSASFQSIASEHLQHNSSLIPRPRRR